MCISSLSDWVKPGLHFMTNHLSWLCRTNFNAIVALFSKTPQILNRLFCSLVCNLALFSRQWMRINLLQFMIFHTNSPALNGNKPIIHICCTKTHTHTYLTQSQNIKSLLYSRFLRLIFCSFSFFNLWSPVIWLQGQKHTHYKFLTILNEKKRV